MTLEHIRPLTQEERQHAKEAAKEAVRRSYGDAPDAHAFARQTVSRYPQWMQLLIAALGVIVLAAAFAPSALRLFNAGRDTFLHGLPDFNQATLAGGAVVILAETTQVVATLALALVAAMQMRLALYATAALATCIAIVGNVFIAQPPTDALTWGIAFAWLEAVCPPVIVLCMAHVLKHQFLHSIEERYASKRAYETAYAAWSASMQTESEQHADWKQYYANALRDALRRANAKSSTARDALQKLTAGDWHALVWREMQSEQWFKGDAPAPADVQPKLQAAPVQVAKVIDAPRIKMHAPSGGGGGKQTGEVDRAVERADFVDGEYQLVCPWCNQVHLHNANVLGLKRALTAHMRRCEGRVQMQTQSANGASHQEAN